MALGGNVTVNTNKSPTRTAVASLITGCCVAGTATGIIEDIGGSHGGDNSSYATPMPMEGILEEEEQRGDHHAFYAAASQQQQQRNRFTSSPLIERDSSLIKEQSGLLSLLASGTFTETSPREITNVATTTNGNGNNSNPHSLHSLRRNTTPPTPSMTMMQTPPRSASRRKKHHLQQSSSQYSPNNNSCPPSPAMELSMARQSANATNQLLMSASSPRSISSRRHRLGSSDSRSVNSASTSSILGSPKVKKQLAAMTIESPTKKARQETNLHDGNNHNNNSSNSNSIVMPNLDIDGVYSAENTVAPSPTAAVTTSTKATNTAAATNTTTTTMARSTIIPQTSSFSSTEIINGSQHKQNIVIWKHYTKSRLDERMDDHLHHLELWTTTTTTNNKKLNEEIINTYKFPRLYLQNPKFMEYNHLKELWWYKLQCGAESTLGHVYDATTSEVFDPSAQPINVWSEPSSTTMKVRGSTYTQDGIKVPSEESMFAVLGVDNFVNEKGSGGSGGMKKSGTDSFMERWKNVCKEVGLESVPFLLVFNFIVPWGNFQTYLIRPDADNGPYSTNHTNRPSEKAWKLFVEGTDEYRNTVLKFIPRIVAGPWMVKKMVGSNPALIGQKLPVSYRGSIEENYLEVSLDVTQGPALGNTIANTVVGKADVVTVDLGFLIEGQEKDGTLPEQMLGMVRLHHLNMKKAYTHAKWEEQLRDMHSC